MRRRQTLNHRGHGGITGKACGVATLIIGPWILNATIHSWMIQSAAAQPTTVVGASFRRGGFWGWTSVPGGLGSRCRIRLGITAQGLETLQRSTKRRDFDHLQRVIQEYDVREIVIGLPLRMSGAEGTQSEKMLVFAEELRKRFRLPVHLWDERLTSAEAQSVAARDGSVDREAREGGGSDGGDFDSAGVDGIRAGLPAFGFRGFRHPE